MRRSVTAGFFGRPAAWLSRTPVHRRAVPCREIQKLKRVLVKFTL
jgi:hypothetical protein